MTDLILARANNMCTQIIPEKMQLYIYNDWPAKSLSEWKMS